jgi:AbrB family looped-hinge helix DNA binding protein
METVFVSPEYEIVIPLAIREAFNIQPGQRMQMIPFKGRIELIPIGPPEAVRGFLAGIDTDVDRDNDQV